MTMAYDQKLADTEKRLRQAEAAINSAYGYCEGAGGHYKDAVEAITATLADFLWPSNRTKECSPECAEQGPWRPHLAKCPVALKVASALEAGVKP